VPSVTRKVQAGRTRRDAVESTVFAALGELLAGGATFTELGVQQISKEAGIGRSTFYVHFADKTDLLVRFAEDSSRELFAIAERWTDSGDRETLERTLLEVIARRREQAPALRALAEVATYEPAAQGAWRRMIASNIDLVRQRIEADQEAGLVPAGVDPAITAAFVTWGVERTLEQHIEAGGDASDEEVAAAVACAIWKAVYGSV